jgi:predicted SnoaL-like aldol condensation-catalyzing enzyme/quinol monooxygenase YgiN
MEVPMVKVGALVRVEAKPGMATELEARMKRSLPAVQAEAGTPAWFALRLGEDSFAVCDVFPDEAACEDHMRAARARLEAFGDVLAGPQNIALTEVVAAKLPGDPGDRLAANKQVVRDFYDGFQRKRDFGALSKPIGARYVQHNPVVADGPAGLEAFVELLEQRFPNLRGEVKRMFAEDDYVVAHVHAVREPGQPGTAIVDIFRLENGNIVEHRDVIQPVPDTAEHNNVMF